MSKVERKISILEVLSNATEATRPSDIGEIIGESALNTGRYLSDMAESGLVQKPDKKKAFYEITEKGRGYLANPPDEVETQELERTTEEKHVREAHKRSTEEITGETTETVPSQSDLFRSIGERLGVGAKKGDIRLDAITYYVQRTADLDDLISVWNALTEMGVANDVKKRWIKIYAQNIPGKEIPQELKEKLESGELEKIKAETGEIPPKPRRFSVVSGEIIGDPEGDYTFREALHYVAQLRGASPDEAGSVALELSKMGPEMLTTILGAMTPLINKEPPQPDTTLSQALQALRDVGAFGKQEGGEGALLSRLDSLGLLRKTGEEGRSTQIEMLDKLNQLGMLKKTGEEDAGSQTIVALQTEVKELRESLQKQEMDTVKNAVVSLSNQLSELRKDMSNQGKLEGRYAILEKAMTSIDSQFSGIRSDARPLLDALAHGGGREPRIKGAEEKREIAKGLREATALEREARQLEDELLFGGLATPSRA